MAIENTVSIDFLSMFLDSIGVFDCCLPSVTWVTTLIQTQTLLHLQSILEPVFYGDLVYEFNRIVGKRNFSDQFKKIIKGYKKVGYNMDVMRQSV